MKITQESLRDVAVVRLSGQLMGGPDAEAVRETVQALLQQGQKHILIDLKDVTWVNSTGLGILIASHLAVMSGGGELGLTRISKRIEDIFTVTRLNTVFKIYADEEAALASLAG